MPELYNSFNEKGANFNLFNDTDADEDLQSSPLNQGFLIPIAYCINRIKDPRLKGADYKSAPACDCDSIVKTKIESRVMFAFAGRTVKSLVKPENNTCEIGTFSFDILVNRNGKIIQAVFNTKISSTISDSLKTILLDAAIKSQFMDDDGAPSKQKGNITYVFRLKNEN